MTIATNGFKRAVQTVLMVGAIMIAAAGVGRAETSTFQVIGLDCQECATKLHQSVRSIEGVTSSSIDWKSGRGMVDASSAIERGTIRQAVRAVGYDAVFPGEQVTAVVAAGSVRHAGLDVADHSGSLETQALLASGKITIVDFYADWCGPCHSLDTIINNVMTGHPNVAERRVNLSDWDSASSRDARRRFKIRALPFVRVYDANGRVIAEISGVRKVCQLAAAIEQAEAQGSTAIASSSSRPSSSARR